MYLIHRFKMSMDLETLQEISTINSLSAKDYRVLLKLMCHVDGRSFRKVDISRYAKYLELSKKQVKKSIDKLIDAELLEKGRNEHVKEGYKFRF